MLELWVQFTALSRILVRPVMCIKAFGETFQRGHSHLFSTNAPNAKPSHPYIIGRQRLLPWQGRQRQAFIVFLTGCGGSRPHFARPGGISSNCSPYQIANAKPTCCS
uniref:Putative secreted peptide n=1 Tax=Anopheles braziliensis TaxID=58242 RepID=A0A2M3ZUD6_9DIPT